jgi:hypothetical protein
MTAYKLFCRRAVYPSHTECAIHIRLLGRVALCGIPFLVTALMHAQLMTTATINGTVYVAGMDHLPDVPEELVPHYAGTTHIYGGGEQAWERGEKDFHPLPLSGLLGPVRIIPRRKVTMRLNPV